jgi:energy-coupling factor transporter ATP-binding protein EcfA2
MPESSKKPPKKKSAPPTSGRAAKSPRKKPTPPTSGPTAKPPRKKPTPSLPPANARLGQVFKFLKELNNLRNPVPRDLSSYSDVLRLDSWPAHPCINVRRGDRTSEADDGHGEAMEPVIRVKRPTLTSCPPPPAALDEWLKPGWQSPESPAQVLKSRNTKKGKKTITIAFEDDADRVSAWEKWSALRAKWIEAERPALEAMEIFERVHTLWTTMQREGDRVELVLADGVLGHKGADVRHPVLLQVIGLEFDPSGPEFQFGTGTEPPALNRALLRLIPSIEGRMVAHFDQQLETSPVEPLGGESAEGFFRTLVQGFFTNGVFLEKESPPTNRPAIWREPVLFLRPRTAGLGSSLDHILEDLENGKNEVPPGLARIVGVDSEAPRMPIQSGATAASAPATIGTIPDILFSKPANAAQFEIAARLAQSKSVLVQGPPGTGKTHTIANLLGFLLAQGKTVLVTAHTTKALRVLRRQVDEALQPLCLSVLDSDAESQAQLAQAAQQIAERLSGSHAASLRGEAARLREKRLELLEEAAELRRRLRDARFGELEAIIFAGEGLGPIEAAKRIKAGAERDGWIPGPIEPLVPCPLAEAEVRQLYSSQSTLTAHDEAQLAIPQPALEHLVQPADFLLLAEERAGADSLAQNHRPDLWPHGVSADCHAAHLQDLHQRVRAAATLLGREEGWLREVLFAGCGGFRRGAG